MTDASPEVVERVAPFEELVAEAYQQGWRDGCETLVEDYPDAEVPHRDAMSEGCGDHMARTWPKLVAALSAIPDVVGVLREARAFIANSDNATGYCCCGSKMEDHDIGSGHPPVDDGLYAAVAMLTRIDETLSKHSRVKSLDNLTNI